MRVTLACAEEKKDHRRSTYQFPSASSDQGGDELLHWLLADIEYQSHKQLSPGLG